jgi:hypothetical protein
MMQLVCVACFEAAILKQFILNACARECFVCVCVCVCVCVWCVCVCMCAWCVCVCMYVCVVCVCVCMNVCVWYVYVCVWCVCVYVCVVCVYVCMCGVCMYVYGVFFIILLRHSPLHNVTLHARFVVIHVCKISFKIIICFCLFGALDFTFFQSLWSLQTLRIFFH